MPSRSPIGLTFWPTLVLPLCLGLDLAYHDRQVRERFENAAKSTTAAGGKSLEHDCPADMSLRHDQIVDIKIVIVLGIGNRRLQTLANISGDALAGKLKISKRARNLLAT